MSTATNFKSIYSEFFGDKVAHPLIKRLLALIIDYIILSVICFPVTFYFNGEYMLVLVINFCCMLLYFTICNSRTCSGQTIGKRILNIQTVDQSSKLINILTSLGRTMFILMPINWFPFIFVFNWLYGVSPVTVSISLMPVLTGEIYFLLANSNRQTLHDILLSTQVISKNSGITTVRKISGTVIAGYLITLSVVIFYLILQSGNNILKYF